MTLNSTANVNSSLTSVKSSSEQDGICGEEHENIALKSHLNKYLAVDSFGNVTCDSDEKNENARFTITICSMSQARSKDEHIFWAFKNVERGYYLGTTEDGMICCNAKMPKSRAELWHLHLIPARGASLFALRSLGRERFARVVHADHYQQDQSKQVQLDATISWGSETLFHFKYHDGGRYSVLTSDCMYLTNEGKCIKWKAPADDSSSVPPSECLFTLEYHSGFLAFRDSFSHYLAAAGRSSILRSRSAGVSRDELFTFESAPIQVSFKATFNNRWVSIKQGVDLSANQSESHSNHETFQMTFHKQSQCWSIMTHECNFWTVQPNTSTISVCRPADYSALNRGQFKVAWSDSDATCSIKYVDSATKQERWISARKSGQLYLSTTGSAQAPVKFIIRFQNRRLLNLRPVDGSGFVGLKGCTNRQLEANKTSPDSILIEYVELPNSMLANSSINGDPIKSPGSHDEPDVKLFNVKLNSTKQGSSVLERLHQLESNKQSSNVDLEASMSISQQAKEIDEGIVDDNNNCSPSSDECTPTHASNGSVESSSAPSVASIINSFSNVDVGSANESTTTTFNRQQQQHQQLTHQNANQTPRINSSVFKIASSFESSQVHNSSDSDTASVVTSCSSVSASSGSALSTSNNQCADLLANGNKSLADQLAQTECCYLKLMANERYLVVKDGDMSVMCDASNKACAQSWILELRSHNSIAIRASDTHAYLQLGTNGTISLARCEPKEASLWEF